MKNDPRLQILLNNFSGFKLYGSEWNEVPVTTRDEIAKWTIQQCPVHPSYILNTSGTEGASKFVYFSESSVESQIERIQIVIERYASPSDVIADLTDYVFVSLALSTAKSAKIHCGTVTDYNLALIIAKLNRSSIIVSYATMVHKFLSHLESRKYTIFLTGSPLSEQLHQLVINKLPLSQIIDLYCTTEFGVMGIKEGEWFTLLEHSLLFEVFCDDGSIREEGEGDILITDVSNFSTPFIRYRLGDRVILQNKRVQFLHRSDGLIKIYNDLCSKNNLVALVKRISQREFFTIVIDKKEYEDCMIIIFEQKIINEEELKTILANTYGTKVNVLYEKVSTTPTGKTKHIIDKRQA